MRAAKPRAQGGAGAEADIPGGRGDAPAPRPSRVNCCGFIWSGFQGKAKISASSMPASPRQRRKTPDTIHQVRPRAKRAARAAGDVRTALHPARVTRREKGPRGSLPSRPAFRARSAGDGGGGRAPGKSLPALRIGA